MEDRAFLDAGIWGGGLVWLSELLGGSGEVTFC